MTDSAAIKHAFNLVQREDWAPAWQAVSDILNDHPDDPKGLYLAGVVMRSRGHIGTALTLFRRALALAPQVPNVWMHFGSALHDTHQYDEARKAFQQVRKMLPADPMPLANIAAGYVQQGRAKEAVEWANKALAIKDDNYIARIARAFGNLALGRWQDGWADAQWIYGEKIAIRIYRTRENEEPTWDGTPGQTVVVQADQGLGDMIMFAQCLNDLVRDCKKVIVETNKRMAGLFRRNFPACDVYDTLEEDRIEWPHDYEIDAHVHISWLGQFYRKSDAEFPRMPYLTADPDKAAKWRAWLERLPRPWIGVAWRGGIPRTNHLARSMKLDDLAPILTAGGSLVNLAYQDVGLEIARWNIDHAEQVHVPDVDNGGDYDEWLALISELDHIVTVTTTVAHACGALGKRAYVLVNALPQWRYGYEDDGPLWYPAGALSLYRQRGTEKDWGPVVGRLARDFMAFALPRTKAA